MAKKNNSVRTTGFTTIELLRGIILKNDKTVDVEGSLKDLETFTQELQTAIEAQGLMDNPVIKRILTSHNAEIEAVNKILLTKLELSQEMRLALIYQRSVHEIWTAVLDPEKTVRKISVIEEALTNKLQRVKSKLNIHS